LQGLVVLDLAGVSFCDSSGLRVLIEMRRRADDARTGFRLAAPTPEVDRLLDLSGIHDYFDLYPDVAAALAGRAGG
jgi:anti-sigma B factor antagonist